ncbi:CYFA0S01e04104g1_1 [Cyberlindnera fabianii]|uniref:CYFA0S01e04104g1_1 n=1 Tax=Cyberlindnera fabianii TaxID=36022 RepID=A0A061APU0_CYBFA|nr:CYFA0S01e04104g1_1 [Cyberlindnera fabianii]
MGVHQLWNILEPSARPVRLESLSRRKLAVDASIWIYQFLKAVRSQQGQKLHASHIVGFFRRICKLLYFGILPVFVFDGGAPQLKKEIIRNRKERRQGKRDNAEKTAQKLLALQMQKQMETANANASPKKKLENVEVDEDNTEYHYMEELTNPNALARKQSPEKKKFRGSDEYELPKIEGFTHDKHDTRLMNPDEYKDFTEQLHDELDGIDLNTIDPASAEFDALPLTTQYMVLSQLRLRSRLRMGYTKDQLENIFPESLNFSKFQIQMVQRRNYFTQRLMNVSGMSGADDILGQETRRIASEKDRAYKIQKTEGGWALSLEDDKGLNAQNPIDLDKELKRERGDPVASDYDEIEWEDIDLGPTEKKKTNQSISAMPLPPASSLPEGEGTIKSFSFSPSKSRGKKFVDMSDDHAEDDNYHSLRKIEEMELREAIEKSKRDLHKQQELEMQIIEQKSPKGDIKKTKPLEPESDKEDVEFEDIPFDFGETATSTEISSSKPQVVKPSVPKPPVFSLGSKTFSPSIPQPMTNPPPPPPKAANEERTRPEMDHLLNLTSSDSAKRKMPSKEPTPTKDAPQDNPTPVVPSWFQNSFVNPYEAKKKEQQTRKQDESIGLVSWSEAQEMLEKEEGDKQSESDNEVVVNEVINLDSDHEESQTPEESRTPKTDNSIEATKESTSVLEQPTPAPPLDYEFYESEEEQLNDILEREEEEHAEFQKDLNPHILTPSFLETEATLKKQQQKELRDADEVTVAMVREVQELLARFGIPYITAPMEAEAQCAELLRLKLVDGIITDDSDVFLFGGDRVYRNMFHEKHYVEFYSGKELEKQGLSRKKLIELAHLLGSDYTEGLKSIGPVNAMEILANFGDLEKYRDWFMDAQFDTEKQKKENQWEKTLRKKMLKNDVILDKTFPDKRIDQAYLAAEVDHDPTEFVWGDPDLDRLRDFLMETVGWSQERVDQVLVPLIRDINKKKREGTQSTLGEFYDIDSIAGVKRKKTNKRMGEARAKMRKR